MNNNYKSATTAGLLGIFLGGIGAHCWYLGDRKKGTLHVILFGAGLGMTIIVGAIVPTIVSFWTLYKMAGLLAILSGAGYLVMSASSLWGFIEGVQILSQGDAGLAQKGYPVAPMMYHNNGYNNGPMNGQMGPNNYGPNQGQNRNGGQNNGQNSQWGNGYNG